MLPNGRHFTVDEFRSHDGEKYPEVYADRWAELRTLCDGIRDIWGGPLLVVSGYRSPAHNASLVESDNKRGVHGVASGSQHVEGRAADLATRHGKDDVPQLYRVVMNAYRDGRLPLLGGICQYPVSGWLHVDVFRKENGDLRTWVGT